MSEEIVNFPIEEYHENGKLSSKGNYKNGKNHGLWESYDEDGQLVEEEICNKNWAWPMDNQRWNEFGESRRRFEEIDSRED